MKLQVKDIWVALKRGGSITYEPLPKKRKPQDYTQIRLTEEQSYKKLFFLKVLLDHCFVYPVVYIKTFGNLQVSL